MNVNYRIYILIIIIIVIILSIIIVNVVKEKFELLFQEEGKFIYKIFQLFNYFIQSVYF